MIAELRRIWSSIRNVAVRGRLTLIDNAKSIQIQQNELFAGQTKSDIPSPQQYGFESAPLIGADTINLNRGGSLESGWVVMTYDGRYKPLDLHDGETIMYTHRDASSVHRIKFDPDTGEILVETDKTVKVVCKDADIDVSNNATVDVGNNLTTTVKNDLTATVENNADLTVNNNLTATVLNQTSLTTNTAVVNSVVSAVVNCPLTTWTGNIVLTGNLVHTGNLINIGSVKSNNIELHTHDHPGDRGIGSGPSTGLPR